MQHICISSVELARVRLKMNTNLNPSKIPNMLFYIYQNVVSHTSQRIKSQICMT